MGEVVEIWIKRNRRGPMDSRDSTQALLSRGLRGNADQGGRRQVTILSRELWERSCRTLGTPVPPIARRANLLVEGIDLEGCRGRTLRLGEAEIRIFGETRPCERMDEACPGLQAALDPAWSAGAFGEVVREGRIEIGDRVEWIESPGLGTRSS